MACGIALARVEPFSPAIRAPGLVQFVRDEGYRTPKGEACRGLPDLVLGDSFMEALQVPFEESFPYLLGTGLRQATGKQVEVINAAVGGWGKTAR